MATPRQIIFLTSANIPAGLSSLMANLIKRKERAENNLQKVLSNVRMSAILYVPLQLILR